MTLHSLWHDICTTAPPGDFYILGSAAALISGAAAWWEPRDIDLRVCSVRLHHSLNSYFSHCASSVSILRNSCHINYKIGSCVVDLCLANPPEIQLCSNPWLHSRIAITRDGSILEHDKARDLWRSRLLLLESPELLHSDPEGYTNIYIKALSRGWRDPDQQSRRALEPFGFLI
jgi:hypothetical protein